MVRFAPFFFFFFFEFRPKSGRFGRYRPIRPILADTGRYRPISADTDRVGPIWAASAPISAASAPILAASARVGPIRESPRGMTRHDAARTRGLRRPSCVAASDAGALAWEPRPCIPEDNSSALVSYTFSTRFYHSS